ncbi:AraC family transcriptional regulator [Rubrivivax sp. A210]|uniref:cupin domain-containing protein n=1 Tax=Rubrivivax sp. A210 TaxID=2772301 RepID=UPI00191871C9|nr:cupin domain-containing protein [Rubrivivax sp. A210]CAD5371997.1 AraC family transcriptional regulator [Rubrivivax sp. A210]
MPEPSYEDFRHQALACGFDEVLVREWAAGQVLATHTHAFAVSARVVRGEFVLGCEGREQRLQAGDSFELPGGQPHSEHYGPEGATVWVARRHGPA